MKNKLSKILLTSLIAIGLGACGEDTSSINNSEPNVTSSVETSSVETPISETSNDNLSDVQISSTDQSPIKSLEAKETTVKLRVDEQAVLSNYFELKGFKSLSTKQKKVTITSSDPSIVGINAKFTAMTAVRVGTATITVTSDVDTSKSCSFEVVVEDAFFDRKINFIDPSWNVEHETDAQNPYIKVNTNMDQGLFIRNSDGLKWYVETEITVHSVYEGEEWPKFGIVASTSNHCIEYTDNKLYFFLDGQMRMENEWNLYGFCEVLNGYSWAWNKGVDDTMARCKGGIFKNETPIDYNTKFKIGMLRDGFNCHFFLEGQYKVSLKVLGSIFGNYNEETKDYTDPVSCMAGFFSFNSDLTFSNYKFISDSATVDGLIPASPSFITEFDDYNK